ncbi:sensor histidine kinase [Bacillus sp. FJAT-50079]|uniref:sensor histidine kinase n=1 Tax=Bacillus sp. FJAT-50079 TaxID=2833577 RepID=UPI001BCA4383|nr:sensor histidine kinase [Bacillus sp. FJAT-50079]MBS4210093.1 sensor histidine kinase [Bacillus sp. FJAT-50079]
MIRTSIRNKLIVLLLFITIIPFGTSIIISYIHTKESLKDQVIKENSNLLYQGKVNMEGYMKELNGFILSLYNNNDFMNYMRSSNREKNFFTISIVKPVMQSLLYAEENIERVYISFVDDDSLISASKQSTVVFSTGLKMEDEAHYLKAKESPYNMYIEPLHNQRMIDPIVKIKKPQQVIGLHRSFTNAPSNEQIAYITIELRPNKIFELSKNLYNQDSEEFYIISSTGEQIYRSNPDVESSDWIDELIQTDAESGTLEWQDESFKGVMIYNKIADSAGGWMLIKRIPYSTLYESAIQVALINIMFGVIGLTLVILATFFVSFKITSPIRVLLEQIRQVEKGNMNVKFESLGNDEIGYLGARFKEMITKMNRLINREYKLEIENKTNQLKVLQSQINPHFLYNALQSIGTVALKNNVPQIYSLIHHLSKIMRYSMNMDEDVVPLADELNYIEAFLLLQKERFGDQLDYQICAEEEMRSVFIPKMLIQPIVENYFKHGFDSRDKVGIINVQCMKEGAFLRIKVLDNGNGVEADRLTEISQNIGESGGKNIGLKNVYRRLQIYYDGKANLILRNRENGGFIAEMNIPI